MEWYVQKHAKVVTTARATYQRRAKEEADRAADTTTFTDT